MKTLLANDHILLNYKKKKTFKLLLFQKNSSVSQQVKHYELTGNAPQKSKKEMLYGVSLLLCQTSLSVLSTPYRNHAE